MVFHPISITDKAVYEKYYKTEYRMGSDATFTTPYVWAESSNMALCVTDDLLCMQGKDKNGVPYYMMPVGTGDKEEFLIELYEHCMARSIPFSLVWLSKEDIPLIQNVFGDKVSIESVRNSADYIYDTESLRHLAGKKLHGKRNHLNTFKANYAYSIKDITPDTIWSAREFVLKRCNTAEETCAMERLFDVYFDLSLTGMLLYVEETLVGVTVGEQINEDTALIHLEKADISYSGAYAAVNNLFVENYFSHTKFINREEDMGIEGLRKAKLSYRPAFLLEKFTAMERNV